MTIEEEIKNLQKEIKEIEKEIDKFVSPRETMIAKKEEEIERLQAQREKGLGELRREYLKALKEFKKAPSDEKMFELLEKLKQIKFEAMQSPDDQYKILKEQYFLFEYIYAKDDVDLVEKYLLAKMSMDQSDLDKFDDIIAEYKEHMKEGVYTHTKNSKYNMDNNHTFSYEIQQLMFMLGKKDFYAAQTTEDKIYRSKKFQKYMLRAVAGAYGYWQLYLYADGEFGHKDYERTRFEELHDMAFKDEAQKHQTQQI